MQSGIGNRINAVAAKDPIVACPSGQEIIAESANQDIVAIIPGEGVVTHAAGNILEVVNPQRTVSHTSGKIHAHISQILGIVNRVVTKAGINRTGKCCLVSKVENIVAGPADQIFHVLKTIKDAGLIIRFSCRDGAVLVDCNIQVTGLS